MSITHGAIEDIINVLNETGIEGLIEQTEFIAQCLTAWFEASGRFENKSKTKTISLSSENVVYQGRILVSVLALMPAIIWILKKKKVVLISEKASKVLIDWFKGIAKQANMIEKGVFISKDKFKAKGYLGSGGIGRFRDSLWAVIIGNRKITKSHKPESIRQWADNNREKVLESLQTRKK